MQSGRLRSEIPRPSGARLILPALFLVLAVLLQGPDAAFADRLTRKTIYSDGSTTWFAFPGRLLAHDESGDEWSTVSRELDLDEGTAIRFFELDDDILWVATSDGLLNSDVRYHDWIRYGVETGFPSGSIRDLSFTDDYVWIATDAGAVRLDRFLDEVTVFTSAEGLAADSVFAVHASGDHVWAGTSRGVSRYDTEHETWRNFYSGKALGDAPVRDVFAHAGNVWFLGDDRLTRFDETTESFRVFEAADGLNLENRTDIFQYADKIYTSGNGRVAVYDAGLDAWSNFTFLDELPSKDVTSLLVREDEIWFASPGGVSLFTPSTGEWLHYNEATGLAAGNVRLLYKGSRFVYALGDRGVGYYDPAEDEWRMKERPRDGAENGGAGGGASSPSSGRFPIIPSSRLFSITPDGLETALPGGRSARLSGRYAFLAETRGETGSDEAPTLDYQMRTHALLHADLKDSRALHAFYDNRSIDETFYGATYRGAWEDNVRKVHGGYYTTRFHGSSILEPVSSEGAEAVFAAGPRHGVIQRRSFILEASGGLRRGRRHTDIFSGNMLDHEVEISSASPVTGFFFHLHGDPGELPLDEGGESIYLKVDAASYSGTSSVIEGENIAGIFGDWVLLTAGVDYFADYTDGTILFVSYYGASDTLTASYTGGSGSLEAVLHAGGGESRELRNRYSLGAGDIVPLGFALTVTDTLGATVPLSTLGLDDNADGAVDPSRIDFKNGYLAFPGFDNPLDGTGAVIRASYRTRRANFSLDHPRVIAGSETVAIDGVAAERNADYIVVYPTGRIIFVNEDLLGEESVVQVDYEYEIPESDRREEVAALRASFAPGDFLVFDAGVTRVGASGDGDDGSGGGNGAAGDAGDPARLIFDAAADYRADWRASDAALRLRPEVAVEQTDEKEPGDAASAAGGVLTGRWRRLEARAEYQWFSREFAGTDSRLTETGTLDERIRGDVEWRLAEWLPIRGGWLDEDGRDPDSGVRRRKRERFGSMLLARQSLPRLTVRLTDKDMTGGGEDRSEQRLELELDHEFGRRSLDMLHLERLRLLSYFRRSAAVEEDGADDVRTRANDIYFGAKCSPTAAWFLNFDYKHYAQRGDATGGWEETAVLHDVDLVSVSDIWSGFATSVSLDGSYRRDLADAAENLYDVNADLRMSCSLTLYPGMWLDPLEPILLNLGLSETRDEYFAGTEADANPFRLVDTSLNTEALRTRGWMFKGTIRPRSLPLILTQGAELGVTRRRELMTKTESGSDKYTFRAEVFPGRPSRLTADCVVALEETPPDGQDRETTATLTWDALLSEALLLKARLRGRSERVEEGVFSSGEEEIAPLVRLRYRLRDRPLPGRIDLTGEGELTRASGDGGAASYGWRGMLRFEWWLGEFVYTLLSGDMSREAADPGAAAEDIPIDYGADLRINVVF